MPFKDVERRRAYQRQRWASFTPEHRRALLKNFPSRAPSARRREHIKGRYGLTLEQWDAMFEAQGRCCAICKATAPGWKRGWHTDHDHKTNTVRAILCHLCNRTLGHMKEDVSRFRAFIEYLEKHAVVQGSL